MLRHSINLNAETEQKTVITLFIADTLDYNTINIWRAVSMVPLQASNSDKIAENVTVGGLVLRSFPPTRKCGKRLKAKRGTIAETFCISTFINDMICHSKKIQTLLNNEVFWLLLGFYVYSRGKFF